jgi:CheY-like chemotaxis protein
MNNLSPPDILIVEDYADGREMLQLLLELWGYQVEVAADGPEGLAKARRLRPRRALIDIGLPGLNGYELAREIRAEPEGWNIYLIALTGYSHPQNRRFAFEAGFDQFLIKPVKPEDLNRILSKQVSSRLRVAGEPLPPLPGQAAIPCR